MISLHEVDELNSRLGDAHPADVLKWAFTSIPDLAIAVSFQVGGLVNVHMARQVIDRPVPVLFIQTGFHFPETIGFRDRIVSDWGLELIETRPTLGPERQAAEVHPRLYEVDPDRCCELNKVRPLQEVLDGLGGWVTGLRRDQGATRRETKVVDVQTLHSGREIWKVNPLATWTASEVWRYAEEHDIPTHPLYDRGYLSIGCAPCTRPVREGEDARAGRWAGREKTECGIHGLGRTG
ncbi:MAG TPA: phosphoadenylyl-sulfate reductase [Actinomycetota bacterium]|nr:phosphoadenylyl-sulfate reductase [Actinomycetota bacterium]